MQKALVQVYIILTRLRKTHLAYNKRRINTMATNELIAKLNELFELHRMVEELNAEIEGVR